MAKYVIYKLTEFIRVVDKFVFRQIPSGAASGYANIEKVEGNTVKWNQKLSYFHKVGSSPVVYYPINTLNNFTSSITLDQYPSWGVVGHVYYLQFYYKFSQDFSGTFSYRNYLNYGQQTTLTPSYILTSYKTIFNCRRKDTFNFYISLSVGNVDLGYLNAIDLTAIFGAGNEPTTVADFEAWMTQNIGTLPYYDYNAGELLSVKMSGMQTQDSSQQTLDTIALDVTTITGINTATNVREVIFADGMKQADREGTVKDTLDPRSDTATVKVGSRAYQSGDESDTDVITDGTTTYYALTTPIEYTDLQDANGNPLNPRYKVEHGGTEQVLPVNTSSPTTVAPTLTTTYTKDNN